MGKERYQRIHEQDGAELRSLSVEEIDRLRNYASELCGYENKRKVNLRQFILPIPPEKRITNWPSLFVKLALTAVITGVVSYGFLSLFNSIKNYGRNNTIRELNELERKGEIKIYRKRDIDKMGKELEELIDNERARYYLKGLSKRDE